MIGYKLFRVRKDGTIAPLFINRRLTIPVGQWLKAECHPTKGFAVRAGWHVMAKPQAPHLSEKGRKWFKVEIEDYAPFTRPTSQGGLWFLAQRMRVIKEVDPQAERADIQDLRFAEWLGDLSLTAEE